MTRLYISFKFKWDPRRWQNRYVRNIRGDGRNSRFVAQQQAGRLWGTHLNAMVVERKIGRRPPWGSSTSTLGLWLCIGLARALFICKGSLCLREMTSRPAPIPFCPQDFPFRFPVSRVHAPRHPPPQKFFCTLLYISIAHMSHNICRFCPSERTIHCECFALHSRALVFATRRFLLLLLLSRASRHHVLTF